MKQIDGAVFLTPRDYAGSDAMPSLSERRVEAFTQRYLKPLIVVGAVVLSFAYASLFQEIARTIEFWSFLQAK